MHNRLIVVEDENINIKIRIALTLKLNKLLIVKQILLLGILRNVQRTVWRIQILMLGCKGLNASAFDILKF